jgi:hypothetical protein
MCIEVGTGLPHSVLPLELLFVATDFAIFPPISSGLLPNPEHKVHGETKMILPSSISPKTCFCSFPQCVTPKPLPQACKVALTEREKKKGAPAMILKKEWDMQQR